MSRLKIDDGYCAYLVKNAKFVGKYQIPELKRQEIIIPRGLIPFDKRKKFNENDLGIDFFMHDKTFSQIITHCDNYLDDLRRYACILTPDCSLYRDMPLCLQITNTYFNRAVGHHLQENNFLTYPTIRWGDERSFEFCFAGVPKNYIVAISTHGCIRSNENKYYFRLGLEKMLTILRPQIVLVHGAMPNKVFDGLLDRAKFVHYDSFIKMKKEGL